MINVDIPTPFTIAGVSCGSRSYGFGGAEAAEEGDDWRLFRTEKTGMGNEMRGRQLINPLWRSMRTTIHRGDGIGKFIIKGL